MIGSIGFLCQEIVLVVFKRLGAIQLVGRADESACIVVVSRSYQIQCWHHGLRQVAIIVVFELSLDAQCIGDLRGKASAVYGYVRRHLFRGRNVGQISIRVVGVSRGVPIRVGDTGEIVHLVIGHVRGRIVGIVLQCETGDVSFLIVTNILNLELIILNVGWKLGMRVVAISIAARIILGSRYGGDDVVCVESIVERRCLPIAQDVNL